MVMNLNQLKKRVDALVEMGYGRLPVFIDPAIDDESGLVNIDSVQVEAAITANEDGHEIEGKDGFPQERDVVAIKAVPLIGWNCE